MNRPTHARALDATEASIHGWLQDYVSQPHDHIGRSGAVCPFVLPSLRAGSLEIRVRPVGAHPSAASIAVTLRNAIEEFHHIEWRGSNVALRSLIVAMPDLAKPRLLDEAHEMVKPAAVHVGMMLGQFHPDCDVPAARNPAFPVSRSPVPLVAIRTMALHDILFLAEREDWFAEYRSRFGGHYRPGRDAIDPVFVELFHNACRQYGAAA